MVPDLLHVVPVGHDAVLDGVLEGQDTTLVLGLVANVGVLLVHADHDSRVLGAAHNGREHGAGGVVAGEASLHGSVCVCKRGERGGGEGEGGEEGEGLSGYAIRQKKILACLCVCGLQAGNPASQQT